jgi:hypothetical protein
MAMVETAVDNAAVSREKRGLYDESKGVRDDRV